MPRVLKIDSITHRPICKTAGAGGFSGHNYLCHSKARIGVTGQCKRCTIPFFESGVSIDKMVGCGNAVPCGSNVNGSGWDFDLAFGTGSSYAATQSNDGTGTVDNEWASVRFTGAATERNAVAPFTYKWSTGSTSAGVNDLGPGAAGTYSVTVTDKTGKSKTKDMPAIWTRMITLAELETFTAAQTQFQKLQSGGAIADPTGLTFFFIFRSLDGQNGPAVVLGGKPPWLIGFHAGPWNPADPYNPTAAEHAAADQLAIKVSDLADTTQNSWDSVSGPVIQENEYLYTANQTAGTLYKPKFHVDDSYRLFTCEQGQPASWNLKNGGTVADTDGNGTSAVGSIWHCSIRDSDGDKIIRLNTNVVVQ